MKRNILILIVALSLGAAAHVVAGPDEDPGSVYNYNINWVVQTNPTEIVVAVQAEYCSACNPNSGSDAGCPAFTHGYPPAYYPYHYWNYSVCYYNPGRFAAIRVCDNLGVPLASDKMVCTPGNWPLTGVQEKQFVFPGLSVMAGDLVIVEADIFCSWCGHYYPTPIPLTIIGSNSDTTYTGDTSGLVGTSANVSAVLVDDGTGDPLAGRSITFTLDALAPVTATTNASGVASTTIPIPAAMAAGIYPMTARFDGDAEYFPSSDTVDFEVIVNRPPVADPDGPYLVAAGAPCALDGSGSSDPDGDPLTYVWDCGDGGTATGVTPTYVYSGAGIYDVCLTVSDGIASDTQCTYAVVYDPDAGFVTGGGWINSPAGAYVPDPLLTGKANFGFVSKYKKGATEPTGQTEFQFQTADLNFHSSSYDWLVVTGSNYAKFKGTGTINGSGDYKFMLWAGDGPDTFRIKIWTEDNLGNETVIYDNGMNQPIDGGSIVVHRK